MCWVREFVGLLRQEVFPSNVRVILSNCMLNSGYTPKLVRSI